jgi:hypothetical protein
MSDTDKWIIIYAMFVLAVAFALSQHRSIVKLTQQNVLLTQQILNHRCAPVDTVPPIVLRAEPETQIKINDDMLTATVTIIHEYNVDGLRIQQIQNVRDVPYGYGYGDGDGDE